MGLCEGTITPENVRGLETCVGRRLVGLTRMILLKSEVSEIGVIGEEAESFIVFGASEGPVSHLDSVAGADSFPRPTNKATTPPPQQQPHQDRTSHVC